MNAKATRKELHGLINAIPDNNLETIKPILSEHPENYTGWADVKKEPWYGNWGKK